MSSAKAGRKGMACRGMTCDGQSQSARVARHLDVDDQLVGGSSQAFSEWNVSSFGGRSIHGAGKTERGCEVAERRADGENHLIRMRT